MPSTIDFVEFVKEQLGRTGHITHKKMFGEYMIYCNEKPVILICDNTAFIKQLDCVKPYLQNAEAGFPYDGAKEYYIADIDNGELLQTIVKELEKVVPIPKKRVKKI
ncbi:competence protein TfoX [Campylobacterota bacterium]|nr:competence protein TfoX [Campylobacterota bacterium]